MRRMWILVLAIVIMAVILGVGATMAFFTSSATNQNNELTAGTLNLKADRDNGDIVPGPVFYTTPEEGQTSSGAPGLYPIGHWVPGDVYHRVLQIENIGSLDGWLKSVRVTLGAGSSRYLADKLQVKISTDPEGLNSIISGNLGQFIDADQVFSPDPLGCDVGDVVDLHFWVTLPSDADNSYQNLNLKATFLVNAEQKANNP